MHSCRVTRQKAYPQKDDPVGRIQPVERRGLDPVDLARLKTANPFSIVSVSCSGR